MERRVSLTQIVKETEFNRCQVKALIKKMRLPYEEKLYSPIGTSKIITYKTYDISLFYKEVNKLIKKRKLDDVIDGF